jgi:DNA invertase Pin-like site-specific DNA recombinase
MRSALAFSYVRFSTPEQRKGDSLRRQTEKVAEWCTKKRVTLDTSVTLHDLGKSAFTGKHRVNPDRNALAAFLRLVEDGRVPRGSFLIVEALDRLTREHVRPALTLLLNLIEAGVRVVQLSPAEAVYDEDVEPMALMMAVMELSRGHGESKRKSELIGPAWREKKAKARDGVVMTARTPGWLTVSPGREKFVVVPAAAAAVRSAFRLAADGYGIPSIVRRLTEDKVPAIGRTGAWTRSYVHLLLKDRRAVGEYRPMRAGVPDGDPIPNYYPAVVTEDEWLAARAGAAQRRRPGVLGRKRSGETRKKRGESNPATEEVTVRENVNVFSGLLRNAREGDTYQMTSRHSRSPGRPVHTIQILINKNAEEGVARGWSFPYAPFEAAVLTALKEIDPRDVLDSSPERRKSDSVADTATELAGVEAELASAAEYMAAAGFSPTIGKRVTDLEARKAEVSARLAELRQAAAVPVSAAWPDLKSLAAVLGSALDPRDARLRLRTAIRRTVSSMHVLIVPRGRDRLAALTLGFSDSTARRNVLIFYRPAANPGGSSPSPARWAVRSIKHPDDGLGLSNFDLRQEHLVPSDDGRSGVAGWRETERDLLAYPRDIIDRLLSNGFVVEGGKQEPGVRPSPPPRTLPRPR